MPDVMPFDPMYYDPIPPSNYSPSPSGAGAFPGGQSIFWPRPSLVQGLMNPDIDPRRRPKPSTPMTNDYKKYMEGLDKLWEYETEVQPNYLDLTAWRYRNDPYHVPNFLDQYRPLRDPHWLAPGQSPGLDSAAGEGKSSAKYLHPNSAGIFVPSNELDTPYMPRVGQHYEHRQDTNIAQREKAFSQGLDEVIRPGEVLRIDKSIYPGDVRTQWYP